MLISTKAVHAYINFIKDNGDDPQEFFENLEIDYHFISDESKFISWENFKLITQTLNKKYHDFYAGMCNHGLSNKYSKQIVDILTRVISFSLVGDFVLKYAFKTYYDDFIKVELVKKTRHNFDIRIKFNQEEDHFPEFTDMYKEVFQFVPKLISNSLEWKIETSFHNNIFTYHITESRQKPFKKMNIRYNLLRLLKIDKYYQNLLHRNLQSNIELEKLNQDLAQAKLKLKEANEEVLMVNRILSHDIANKLQFALFSKRLLEKGHNEKAIEMLDLFCNSINGIIENSKHFTGEHSKLVFGHVKLKELLDELLFEYRPKAEEKNIDLVLVYDLEESMCVLSNKGALKDNVLGNILGNAIKFSQKNSKIYIHAKVENNELLVTCTDTGIGMSKELLEAKKGNDKSISSLNGTIGEKGRGLGLFIVKKVSHDLGFKLGFESEEGKGLKVLLTKSLSQSQ